MAHSTRALRARQAAYKTRVRWMWGCGCVLYYVVRAILLPPTFPCEHTQKRVLLGRAGDQSLYTQLLTVMALMVLDGVTRADVWLRNFRLMHLQVCHNCCPVRLHTSRAYAPDLHVHDDLHPHPPTHTHTPAHTYTHTHVHTHTRKPTCRCATSVARCACPLGSLQ